MDVLVVGGGPAGWAIAGACARLGLRTELVDPNPYRRWTATYGAWRDEVADATLSAAVAAEGSAVAYGTRRHELGWRYLVFDNPALQRHLGHPDLRVRTGTATGIAGTAGAAVVVDATGPRRAVLGGRPRSTAAEQTAVGVILPADRAARICPPDTVLLMDWRSVPGGTGTAGWPTFLYGVPVGAGKVLLEETSLARRPGLPLGILRERLHARLGAHGVDPTGCPEETVRFPLDLPLPRRGRGPVVPFGASAPFVHPATGFSVGASLRSAPRVAAAIRDGLDSGAPSVAARRARRVVWSPQTRGVHAMRTAGLRALLVMQPDDLPRFFDLFFDLAPRHRWAYLTGRDDLRGTAATMGALFAAADPRMRRHLVARGLDPRRVHAD